MTTRRGEDGALWLALAGSACTATTAMVVSGAAEGWTGIRIGIAAVAVLVVIGAAVETARQRRRFRRSKESALGHLDGT
jgi:hypothetical protein